MIPPRGQPTHGPYGDSASRLIDISMSLGTSSMIWPGHPPFELRPFKRLSDGHDTEVSELRMSTHSGTHVDAPRHILAGAAGSDSIDLESLVGEATVIDCTDVDDEITPAHLERHGPMSPRALLKTQSSRLRPGDPFPERWAALTPAAAQWLVGRGVRLVGTDFLSIEPPTSTEKRVHRILIEGGVAILENLRLAHVSPGPYELICLPIRLVDADGVPARAILRVRSEHHPPG